MSLVVNNLSGSIEKFVFKNETNGYTVVCINTGKQVVTCAGIFPNCNVGETVDCTGKYVDGKYGQQFNVNTVKVTPPQDEIGLVRYLSSGLIKGLGPKTAEAIVSKFGKDTLDVMENNPSRLTKIKGINSKKLAEISNSIVQLRQMQKSITFLQSKGIGINMCIKIYKEYKDSTIQILLSNPYRLIEDIEGIGFLTADKIAQEIGIEPNSAFRVRSGLVYVLRQAVEKEGNTYLPFDTAVQLSLQLLSLDDPQLVINVIDELVVDYKIKVIEIDELKVIMSMLCYQVEKGIANKLLQLYSQANNLNLNFEQELEEFEMVHNIKLHPAQVNAIQLSVNSGVCIVTGGPGTGKTTIIRNILGIFQKHNLKVTMLAPTGRAAKRIYESTGVEASTIHRALARKDNVNSKPDSLSSDVILIDEVSMVDIFLFRNLLNAMHKGTKLVLVGDKDQLPSVGAGNVLRDLINSNTLPIANLSFIYRQGETSLIAKNAHNINSGNEPMLDNNKSDFFFVKVDNNSELPKVLGSLVEQRLPKFLDIEPSKVQVLSALKSGSAGVIALNKYLQDLLNPLALGGKQIVTDEWNFRVNDKVMHTVNNYKLKWKLQLSIEEGVGVFNGDMGKIVDILDTGEIVVLFEDDRVVYYNGEDRSQLSLAYAMTVHKSQGSEFDVVVMPCVFGSPIILTRNLLYTAITRAKKMVVLVGSKNAIKRMVDNDYIALRYSSLSYFLTKLRDSYLV